MLYPRAIPRSLSRSLAQAQKRSHASQPTNFQQWRLSHLRMATARKIQLTPDNAGIFSVGKPSQESAETASRLLQENHEKYNLFFNDSGFHNHIVHQVLTLYGLGAPSSVLEAHFKANSTYQKPPKPLREENVVAMGTPEGFERGLGDMEYTHDYMEFFAREIEKRGVEDVLREYLFAGTERAEDMLVRLFSGFLHPIIHLGFGLEFGQPAIVAEALAETAVHQNWLTPFFVGAEKAAKESQTSKTLTQLLDEIHADEKLRTAVEWDDGNKIRDGILVRAPQEMIHYASQFRVSPDQLAVKTAEMYDAVVFYTSAAQHPPKQVKFDFYFMHCVNSSVFWPTLNALPWLSDKEKARLLEWKGRMDLVMYASRKSPELLSQEIEGYKGKEVGQEGGWEGLAERLYKIAEDDGHAVKLLRAVGVGERLCDGKGKVGDGWGTIGRMVVDSVEDAKESPWARSVGFAEAWKDYEDRTPRGNL